MGTAGPLALANEILNDGSGNPFFVLNRCALLSHSILTLPAVSVDTAMSLASGTNVMISDSGFSQPLLIS